MATTGFTDYIEVGQVGVLGEDELDYLGSVPARARAGLFGAIVPLTLKALHMDPALGSAVLLTTVTDIAGFGFLLVLASWLLV